MTNTATSGTTAPRSGPTTCSETDKGPAGIAPSRALPSVRVGSSVGGRSPLRTPPLLAASLHGHLALAPVLGHVLALHPLRHRDAVLASRLVEGLDLGDLPVRVDLAPLGGPEVEPLEAEVGHSVAGVDLASRVLCSHHGFFLPFLLRSGHPGIARVTTKSLCPRCLRSSPMAAPRSGAVHSKKVSGSPFLGS